MTFHTKPPTARRTAVLLAGLLAAGLNACGTSRRPLDRAGSSAAFAHLRASLDTYRELGYLVGPPSFPVVGSAHVLRAAGDSAWIGFAASLPPAALRFAREGGLYAARYRVVIAVTVGSDTLHYLERRETVRVDDFPQTASADPVVVFQRFLSVPAAERVVLDVAIRELTTRNEAVGRLVVDASGTGDAPILVHRATPRVALDQPPPLIVEPRGTTAAAQTPPSLLVETGSRGVETVEIETDGAVVWSGKLSLSEPSGGPVTGMVAFPLQDVPPGPAVVRVKRPEGGGPALTVIAALSSRWVPASWEAALDQLRYAVSADTASTWRGLPAAGRAAAWQRLSRATDPDTTTPGNEYFDEYFERMDLANDRFDEPGRPGWQTDRGEVLVRLGEPDQRRFVRPERQGEPARIVWEYEDSVPSRAVIVFEDVNDFGVYVMTQRSRATLRRVVRQMAAAGTAGFPETT